MKLWFLIVIVASIGAAACGGSNPGVPIPAIPRAENAGTATLAPIPWKPERWILGSEKLRHLLAYGQQTFTIKTSGSSFKFPSWGGFSGTGYYTRNNAPSGASLQITNSGNSNVLGVPVYGVGTVVLYFEAQLVAGSSVTFKSASKTMQLTSPQLQTGASYWIAVYLWNQLIESYSAGVASNGTLTFQTPLNKVALTYNTPIGAELSIVATPTPSPSPTPTPTPTPQPTPTPTPLPTPTPTPTPTP